MLPQTINAPQNHFRWGLRPMLCTEKLIKSHHPQLTQHKRPIAKSLAVLLCLKLHSDLPWFWIFVVSMSSFTSAASLVQINCQWQKLSLWDIEFTYTQH